MATPFLDGVEGAQQWLFAAQGLSEVDEEERLDTITKDPISLADVPVSSDDHVRPITFQTLDNDRKWRSEVRDGKILYRIAPHPTYVRVDDQIVRRESCSPQDARKAKALMVPQITTVIYERGVIQPDHLDMFHVILSLMYKRYEDTGVASGIVETTKVEIAKILGASPNGHLSKSVDEALQTLSGFRMFKSYLAPKEGEPGFGLITTHEIHQMGAFFTNTKVELYGGGSGPGGGRSPDVISVDVNPGYVRSMVGDRTDRMYVTHSLNLTQNLQHGIRWKRQMHRMIDARIDHTGRFQIPLYELWLSCLGGNERDVDASNPSRWRKIKHKIMATLREWESTGYLDKVQTFRRAPMGAMGALAGGGDVALKMDGMELTVPAYNPLLTKKGLLEWISCEAGPNFHSGRLQNRPTFARELVRASLSDERGAEKLVKELGADFVVDVSFKRMKRFLTLLGERSNRLRAVAWLSEAYPVPTRIEQVTMVHAERTRVLQSRAKGLPLETGRLAAHAARRQRIVMRRATEVMEGVDIHDLYTNRTPAVHRLAIEVVACYALALDRVIAERQETRSVLNDEYRLVHPESESVFQQVKGAAREIAIRAGSLLTWYEQMACRISENAPARFGQPLPAEVNARMMGLFPEPFSIIYQMGQAGRCEWERHLAGIYRMRLWERMMEQDKMDEVDPPQ